MVSECPNSPPYGDDDSWISIEKGLKESSRRLRRCCDGYGVDDGSTDEEMGGCN
ncbi:hypothetical protein F2Q69_00054435 [Brassica cretica]|uniref:Uncharacterized protein n=1 Tax=Brassica cretica TaxID=69181 RepID=A0A8S9MSS2_BRACR|nr:hypothetical protein F2Q69_00054435 [Brassica cretica]